MIRVSLIRQESLSSDFEKKNQARNTLFLFHHFTRYLSEWDILILALLAIIIYVCNKEQNNKPTYFLEQIEHIRLYIMRERTFKLQYR